MFKCAIHKIELAVRFVGVGSFNERYCPACIRESAEKAFGGKVAR